MPLMTGFSSGKNVFPSHHDDLAAFATQHDVAAWGGSVLDGGAGIVNA
jgi:hypothetical protein